MLRRRALALVFLLTAGVQAEEPPERRLGSLARAGDVEGPLDWVLERVASGTDEWSAERLQDEISARLTQLAGRITALDLGESALEGLLAPDFRSGMLECPPLSRTHETPTLLVERGTDREEGDAASASAPAFSEGLRRIFAGASSLEKSKFKVFRIRVPRPPSLVVPMRVLLEADGPASTEGRFQVRATWDLEWVRVSSEWRLRAVLPISFERVIAKERPFLDVTEAALGANRSYREQLQVGLDAWRTRIDSATGIDIYGHQGVSVGDHDGDGWEDFYIGQPAGLPNRLFRNRGNGSFEDVTEAAGVGVLDTTGGSLFVDLDQDGELDLVVVTSLEVLVFENTGGGRFRRREATGIEAIGQEGASGMGCAAADHDQDGDLDLYVFSYVFWAGAGSKTLTSYPYPYHDANNGAPNFLFRNDGGFRFTDVTVPSGLDVNNRRFSLAASWCDYDDDGDQDLYVANDFGKNNLYRNEGGGKFRDVAAEAGVEDQGNGMSVTWEDYDNDGRFDLYVGNMWSSAGSRIVEQPGFERGGAELQAIYRRMARGNSLFRSLGGGRFEDVSLRSRSFFGRWAWSCQFIDYDADGREDLFVSNGFVTNEKTDDL